MLLDAFFQVCGEADVDATLVIHAHSIPALL
jgi:hypothetical protein